MIVFPNCKINLGLHITRKRTDGYHDIETVFYPVELNDALETIKFGTWSLEPACPSGSPEVQFSSSGLEIAGQSHNNLCVKAFHLLKKDFPDLTSVQMHLHKTIPMGAGLGGGSADGAFTLKLLDTLFQLNLSMEQLHRYALQLGSDCPFFIRNKPCIATGRGEIMRDIPLDLSAYRFVIVNPGIHISTTEAFTGIKPHQPEQSLETVIQLPVTRWKHSLVNDFEISVSQKHTEITQIKENLYAAGAVYASMTGSGSSVYGIFEKGKNLPHNLNTPYAVVYLS